MLKKTVAAVFLVLLLVPQAWGSSDLNFASGLTQSGFRSLARELGSALSYKNTAPAEPLEITGFDAGGEVTVVPIRNHAAYWKAATGDSAPAAYFIPKIRVRKGLLFGIDLGASYARVPDSNIQLFGAEVSKAILDGSFATPALGIRATYTNLFDVGNLDFQTVGLDASISKGFAFVTPYAGLGAIWIDARAKGKLVSDPAFVAVNGGVPLKREQIWQERFFGGVKISPLPLFSVTGEVEYSGQTTYSLKAAFGF